MSLRRTLRASTQLPHSSVAGGAVTMRGRLPMLAVHALAQPIIGRLIVACAAVSGLALAMPLAGAVMARQFR